jgi:hypothetical protein
LHPTNSTTASRASEIKRVLFSPSCNGGILREPLPAPAPRPAVRGGLVLLVLRSGGHGLGGDPDVPRAPDQRAGARQGRRQGAGRGRQRAHRQGRRAGEGEGGGRREGGRGGVARGGAGEAGVRASRGAAGERARGGDPGRRGGRGAHHRGAQGARTGSAQAQVHHCLQQALMSPEMAVAALVCLWWKYLYISCVDFAGNKYATQREPKIR